MQEDIKRGEIYYADLSPIVGSEQGGIRPVLILQNDKGNCYSPTTIIAAITSKRTKHFLPTHINLHHPKLRYSSKVMLEQVRTIDRERILGYIGTVNDLTMRKVNKALKISFGIMEK